MIIYIKYKTGEITEAEHLKANYDFLYETILEIISTSFVKVVDNAHLEELEYYKIDNLERYSYIHRKKVLRAFAIEWQLAQSNFSTSTEELLFWSGFFEKYGSEYALTEEFRENGII